MEDNVSGSFHGRSEKERKKIIISIVLIPTTNKRLIWTRQYELKERKKKHNGVVGWTGEL